MKITKQYPESKADFVWQFEGLTCSIVYHSTFGHACGYARFPSRPVKEEGYDGILSYVPVHGGITYAEHDGEGIVYGFDTNHCDDDGRRDELNSPEWLRPEVERMATAIRTAAKYEDAYLLASTNEEKAKVLDSFHAEVGGFNLPDNFGAMIKVMSGKL